MNNRIVNAIVLLLAFGMIGWFSFQSYLGSHKAESDVQKSETTKNDFGLLSGEYRSVNTDPPTSEILFETFGATATQGTFKNIDITANFNGGNSSIKVVIDVASIYTAESMRDDHLKGADFFNVESFASIIFESSVIEAKDNGFIAKGNITFLGNTNALEIPFTYNGSANGKENTEVFEGSFDFNPVKYGMESDAGDKVTVKFYTELTKQ